MGDTLTVGMAALRARCKELGITPARSASETQQRIQAEEARLNLCQDEGCPQHGTDHVCIDKDAALTRLDALAEKHDMEAPPTEDFYADLAKAVFGDTLTVEHEPCDGCKTIAAMDFGPIEQRVVMHMGIDMASGPDRAVTAHHPALFAPYGSIPPAMTQVRGTKAVQNDPAAKAAARRKMRKQMRKATRRAQRGG